METDDTKRTVYSEYNIHFLMVLMEVKIILLLFLCY